MQDTNCPDTGGAGAGGRGASCVRFEVNNDTGKRQTLEDSDTNLADKHVSSDMRLSACTPRDGLCNIVRPRRSLCGTTSPTLQGQILCVKSSRNAPHRSRCKCEPMRNDLRNRRCGEHRRLRATAKERSHANLVVLPIDVWLRVLHVCGGDHDARFLNDSTESCVQKFKSEVHNGLSMYGTVVLEVFKVYPAILILITGVKKLHVLVLHVIRVLWLGLLPQRPPEEGRFRFRNPLEVRLLRKTVMIGVEETKTEPSPGFYVAPLKVCHKSQELLEIYDSIRVRVDCVKKRLPEWLELLVIHEQRVELVPVQRARSQRSGVQAQEKIHLLEIVQFLGAERCILRVEIMPGLLRPHGWQLVWLQRAPRTRTLNC